MATVILVRHGRSTANTAGQLSGRLKGVHLDETGQDQARVAGERLAKVTLAALVTSPLERCRETAQALRRAHPNPPRLTADRGLLECDYGDWEGRPLRELAKEKLWAAVQQYPSGVTFPGGESLSAVQARSVDAVRRRDAAVEAEHGAGAVWVAVTHGDIIKSVLADALGMHLDLFQRIQADPASLSIIRYTGSRPYVLGMNTHAGDLAWLATKPHRRKRSSDAAVGGGAGPPQP